MSAWVAAERALEALRTALADLAEESGER